MVLMFCLLHLLCSLTVKSFLFFLLKKLLFLDSFWCLESVHLCEIRNNVHHPIGYFQDPSKFSELQIQAYLKTVAFRREINEVQKAAVGGGVGGLQTSRIASESNREYIFSSSFSGDKQ
jgi:hypothetical protein